MQFSGPTLPRSTIVRSQAADELLVTEVIFSGILNALSVPEMAAVLGYLVGFAATSKRKTHDGTAATEHFLTHPQAARNTPSHRAHTPATAPTPALQLALRAVSECAAALSSAFEHEGIAAESFQLLGIDDELLGLLQAVFVWAGGASFQVTWTTAITYVSRI